MKQISFFQDLTVPSYLKVRHHRADGNSGHALITQEDLDGQFPAGDVFRSILLGRTDSPGARLLITFLDSRYLDGSVLSSERRKEAGVSILRM